jgi:mono/diheme cytochrome c family protein
MRIPHSALLFSLALASPVSANPRIEASPSLQAVESQYATEKPAQNPLALPAKSRGQLLYDNHCTTCHESMVHIRTRQQVSTLQELRNQVSRWAAYATLRWNKDEIEEVARYLNTRFYQFEK